MIRTKRPRTPKQLAADIAHISTHSRSMEILDALIDVLLDKKSERSDERALRKMGVIVPRKASNARPDHRSAVR